MLWKDSIRLSPFKKVIKFDVIETAIDWGTNVQI